MNLKKRGLALLMCICMIMTLLPVAAFADDAAVVYGQYTDGVWAEDTSADGTVTSDNITISKTAQPVEGEADTYTINLSVKTTTTTTQVPPGSAATVLVIDVSGSMNFCAECGADEEHYKGCKYKGDVESSQSRLTSAKAAANSFLDSYSGTVSESGNGRYVAIVEFESTSSTVCGWTDVSTSSGLTAVKNVISGLEADGGTNLDAGLKSAAALLGSDAVNGVTSKNVIALTDGQPTFYGNGIEAHGSYGCPDTNNATAASAAKVRALADVYTVCFGVANELCWEKGSVHEWGFLGPSETHSSNGPTVGAFLRDSIATPASEDKTYAYNADNTAELNKAFEAITKEITSGITTGLKVTDSAGKYIDMTAPNQYVSVEEGYEWTLSDPVVSTDGTTTTYTYSVSYTVKLDTTAEGFVEGQYYPTNGETYLTYTDEDGIEKTLNFEIPGVKGVIPSYNVSYAYTGEVPAGAPAVPASASHKQNSTVNVAAAPTLDGYTFSGWSTNDATVSDGSFKMPGKDVTLTGSWSPRSDLSYTVNYYWNGTTDKVADSKVVSGQTFGDTITSETPIAVDGYTDVPVQTSNLTIGTGANVINFYYYKNAELTANSDTVTYDSKEHSVSGFTGAPVGADFSGITVGAKGTEAGEYPAEFARGTIGTVDASEKYIVTAANNGKLVINPIGKVTVTITGNTATKTYNGSEQTVTGYDVSISNPLYTENDFSFSGNASASGTDAGTYNMGLAAEQFVNNNDNFATVEFVVTDGSLTIAKRNVTLTSATDSKVYDRTPLTNDTVTVTGDGFVEGEGASYNVTGTITEVGSVDNEFTYTLNANTKAANYNIDTVNGKLSVTPVTDKVTVTVTGNTGGEKYNGSEQTVTGYDVSISNPLYTENDFSFSGNASASGTDAGTYNMGLAAEQFTNNSKNFTNVEFVVNDGSLTIAKRDVTLTSATDSKVYDNTPLTNDTVTVTGDGFVEGEGASYNVTGTITEVGSVDNEFTYVLNDGTKAANYNIDTVNGKLSVTPLTGVVVTITEHSKTVPYTGTTQTVTGYDVASSSELYKESDFTFNGNATAAGLTADYYPMELKPADFTNTNPNFEDVEFKIVDGGLTITPLDTVIVTITGNTATKTYNGSEQTVTGYDVSISNPLYTENDFSFSGNASASGTDAGTYNMGLAAEQFANKNTNFSNVEFVVTDGSLTIAKRNVTLTSATDSKVYDRTPLTNDTVTVTGDGFVEGEGASYNVTGTITEVGSVDNEFTYTLNANTKAANYNIDTVNGKLSVTPVTDKVTVTVTGNTGGEKYNGSEQTVTGYDVSISNPLYTENDFSFSGNASASGTDAGTYNMGLAAEQFTNNSKNFTNVEFVVNDGSLTIAKRDVTLTSATDSKVYDNTPLTNDTVTVTGDGFVEGEGASYNVTGTITEVGSVDNEFTYVLNDGTKAANYNIDTVNGKLSVTPLTGVVVTITEHSKTVPYTGTTQTVTGYDVASSSELYKESDFTFSGNATATGLTAGYYPMELKPADFTNTNPNFKDVEFKIVDGGLTITPLDTVIVTITGNTDTKAYNGFEQKVEGYTVSINSDLYTEDDFDFNGVAAAARTDVGKTMMGLKAEQFTNTNDNFSKVAFNIVDGWIEITPNETELKVVANSNSWVYDGQDHADGGYTVTFGEEKYELKAGESATLSTGDTVTAVITKTVKHVSDTAEGNNEIVRLAVENEDGYKTVTKLSGTLTITPAPLTITAGSSSQPYVDGVVMCDEYTNTPLVDGDKIESVKITGQQDGPGKSDNVPSDAVIKNAAGEDVTGDYDITYVNGVLEGVPKLEKDVHFNYIMGYKDETIRPNNNITRAEVATIFFRLLTDESRDYYWKETNDFKDIPDNYWACPAISTLTNAGILKGFEDGNFRPNEPITRAQMATIIARFANLSEGTVSFTDIEGHWAQRAIELAAGNGWINGYEGGTFRPNDKITRAATMAMINRVLDRHVENVEDLLPDMNVWSDNMDTSYTFYFDIQEATNFHECQRIDNSPNEKWTVKLDDIDWTVYEF